MHWQDILHWYVRGAARLQGLAHHNGAQSAASSWSIPEGSTDRLSLARTVTLGLERGVKATEMLREQIDHDLLDAVLDDLAKWPMNVATTAAGALRSGLGSASYGHARASSGWLAVEDSCPDAWYSLAAELEKVRNNILPDCQQISCGQLTIDRNIAATRGRGVARAPGPAFWRDCCSSSRYEDLSLCTGICVYHCLQITQRDAPVRAVKPDGSPNELTKTRAKGAVVAAGGDGTPPPISSPPPSVSRCDGLWMTVGVKERRQRHA